MIPFADLPYLVRGILTIFAIAIAFIGVVILCYSTLLRKIRFFILGVIIFLIGFYSVETDYEIEMQRRARIITPLIKKLGDIPYAISTSLLLLSFIASLFILIYLFAKRKTMLTNTSAKEALNKLPSGLCYYYENGRILMANTKMIDLCQRITGTSLLNGRDLYNALENKQIFVFSDLSAYYFRRNLTDYEKEPIYELIAYDVSEFYHKNTELKENNARISRMNEQLKAYKQDMFDSIREKEILETKMNIHDETNRLLLSTRNAIGGDYSDEDKRGLLKTWQQNILLLCKEAGLNSDESDVMSDLSTLAGSYNLSFHAEGDLESLNKYFLQVFVYAAKEAMANACKHGNANNLYAKIYEKEGSYSFSFENDGVIPEGTVTPSGGLKNLKSILMEKKGDLIIETTPGFNLIVNIYK